MELITFIEQALIEDIGNGDHSTLACIPASEQGKAILKVKENGILAGVEIAATIFKLLDPDSQLIIYLQDGTAVHSGDIAFEVKASVHVILKAERLVLNIMQRMSGIATLTHAYTEKVKQYPAQILDTRKTTPNFRWFEKKAVLIGGGHNHRMGLYDMVMLKDNHIDYCGSLETAIDKTNVYLQQQQLDLKIEIEARTLSDVQRILAHGGVHRIMLDNFTPEDLRTAVELIGGRFETEASGGITLDTIEAYAKSNVDYISVGAIIHHAVSMDLSLKAVK